jgi:hypothetical protein
LRDREQTMRLGIPLHRLLRQTITLVHYKSAMQQGEETTIALCRAKTIDPGRTIAETVLPGKSLGGILAKNLTRSAYKTAVEREIVFQTLACDTNIRSCDFQ